MWVVGQGAGMNAAPQQAGLAVGTALQGRWDRHPTAQRRGHARC